MVTWSPNIRPKSFSLSIVYLFPLFNLNENTKVSLEKRKNLELEKLELWLHYHVVTSSFFKFLASPNLPSPLSSLSASLFTMLLLQVSSKLRTLQPFPTQHLNLSPRLSHFSVCPPPSPRSSVKLQQYLSLTPSSHHHWLFHPLTQCTLSPFLLYSSASAFKQIL